LKLIQKLQIKINSFSNMKIKNTSQLPDIEEVVLNKEIYFFCAMPLLSDQHPEGGGAGAQPLLGGSQTQKSL
jgi:hypothetical protein